MCYMRSGNLVLTGKKVHGDAVRGAGGEAAAGGRGGGRKKEPGESELAPGPGPGSAMLLLAQRVAGGGGVPLCQLTSRLLEGLELGASVMSLPALPTALPCPHSHCAALPSFTCPQWLEPRLLLLTC